MNIRYIPTSLLLLYKWRWDGMWRAGNAVTYAWTPPYPLLNILAELKERGVEVKGNK